MNVGRTRLSIMRAVAVPKIDLAIGSQLFNKPGPVLLLANQCARNLTDLGQVGVSVQSSCG